MGPLLGDRGRRARTGAGNLLTQSTVQGRRRRAMGPACARTIPTDTVTAMTPSTPSPTASQYVVDVLDHFSHPDHDYRNIDSVWDWIRADGTVYTEAVEAPAHLRGPLGNCFENSQLAAALDPSLTYCEGVAAFEGGAPMEHAWNIDGDGRVVDVTWVDGCFGYVGISFSAERVRSVLARDKDVFGARPVSIVFSDWTRGFKFLRTGLPIEARPQRKLSWDR